MDRHFDSSVSNSPARVNDKPSTVPTKPDNSAVSRQSVERASFEKALERVRAQEGMTSTATQSSLDGSAVDAMGINASVEEIAQGEQDPTDALSTTDASSKFNAQTQEPTDALVDRFSSQNQSLYPDALQALSQRAADGFGIDSLGIHEAGAAGGTGVAAGNPAPVESSGSMAYWQSAAVSELMQRLEAIPEVHDNTWHFTVLDHSSGVVGLQLERAQSGAWRLNIEFDDDGLLDAERSTQELKAALVHEGHEVESIQVSSEQSRSQPSHG